MQNKNATTKYTLKIIDKDTFMFLFESLAPLIHCLEPMELNCNC